MKTIVPSYYQNFRCIADRCRHSCCIGWEIDIDQNTMALYDDPKAPLYTDFRRHIDRTDTPHFRLDDRERCPFLRPDGLCSIICTMGEESLCQICADHPRFRHCFGGHEEVGLGLCCEAACALILGAKEPVAWLVWEDNGTEEAYTEAEARFFPLRQEIYTHLQNRHIPVGERLTQVLTAYEIPLPPKTCGEWAEILRSLERLDPAWDLWLDRLSSAGAEKLTLPKAVTPWERELENLAMYFAHRHLANCLWEVPEDGETEEIKEAMVPLLGFCAWGVAILYRLFTLGEKMLTEEEREEICRLFSSEIEYSEENLEAVMMLLW